MGSSWVWLWAQSALLIAQLQASGGAQDSQIAPGQRHWPCTDKGDRSAVGLKSGVLRRGEY